MGQKPEPRGRQLEQAATPEALSAMVASVAALQPGSTVAIVRPDPRSAALRVAAARGAEAAQLLTSLPCAGQRAMATGSPVVCITPLRGRQGQAKWCRYPSRTGSLVSLPIQVQGKPWGALLVLFQTPGEPPRGSLVALQNLAVVAGLALERLALGRGTARTAAEPAGLGLLTRREHEVLLFVGQGLRNREIAARLVLSEATVKTHISRILHKLGLPDRTKAAVYLLRAGTAGSPAPPARKPRNR